MKNYQQRTLQKGGYLGYKIYTRLHYKQNNKEQKTLQRQEKTLQKMTRKQTTLQEEENQTTDNLASKLS